MTCHTRELPAGCLDIDNFPHRYEEIGNEELVLRSQTLAYYAVNEAALAETPQCAPSRRIHHDSILRWGDALQRFQRKNDIRITSQKCTSIVLLHELGSLYFLQVE